jgi:UDP-glucose 4-epimerase
VLDDLARGHCAALNDDFPFYHGKIGDCALLARIAREHKLESCVYFAAFIEVGESVTEPAKYFENNVGQGIAFLGALYSAGAKV